MGNSRVVAHEHYLQVTDEHFEQAAQNPAQYPAACDGVSLSENRQEGAENAYCTLLGAENEHAKTKRNGRQRT